MIGKIRGAFLLFFVLVCLVMCFGFPGGSVVKNPPADTGDMDLIPGLGRSPEKETATHSSILAWEIPWKQEHGRLQSMGCKELDVAE